MVVQIHHRASQAFCAASVCEIGRGFYCLMGAERGWDVWVCAGQDGFVVQEEGAVIGGKCEVEDKGAGIVRCDLVVLVPFSPISD
jgi:hypothetical protein